MGGHVQYVIKYSTYRIIKLITEFSSTDFLACPPPALFQSFMAYLLSANFEPGARPGKSKKPSPWLHRVSRPQNFNFYAFYAYIFPLLDHQAWAPADPQICLFFHKIRNKEEDGLNLVKGSTVNCGKVYNFLFCIVRSPRLKRESCRHPKS